MTDTIQYKKNGQAQGGIYTFIDQIRSTVTEYVHDFESLHQWSITEPVEFWSKVWEFCDIKTHKKIEQVMVSGDRFIDTKWFLGATLNITENMLRYHDNRTAIYYQSEYQDIQSVTYKELYQHVCNRVAVFREMGLQPGDRVAAVVTNCPETVYCMLAITALGGVWSACSPDFGLDALSARLTQINPHYFLS